MTDPLEVEYECVRCKLFFTKATIKTVNFRHWLLPKEGIDRYVCRKCLVEIKKDDKRITLFHLDGRKFHKKDIGV